MKTLPVRVRLALWYFAIFAAAACLLSAASWWMLRISIDATEYHDLQERAEDVRSLLANESESQSIAQIQQRFTAIYAIKDDGKWLQIRDQDGNWLYRSKRMIQQNPDLPAPTQLPAAGAIAEFHQGTRFVRTLSYPIVVSGRRYSVQTGLALNKSMVLLKSFSIGLLLLTPAVILLAALGGYWMSRKALQPIALLAAEARRIHDRNLESRFPVSPANDEIAHLSQTLNQMLERIDKAFASVRAFTGNASHELRTPISLLRTEIEVALFKPRQPEQYRATLQHLLDESVRMTALVDNLLALARADANADTPTLAVLEIQTLFDRLATSWQTPLEIAGIRLAIQILPANSACLGDAASVTRLLSILLENAAKFTPHGGSVLLSATAHGESVEFAVEDTGIGIAAQEIPHIFERFYRSPQQGPAAPRGSGLGLSLAKWIAERHGTQLTVQSQPGQGSRFAFTLQRSTPPVTSPRSSLVSPPPTEIETR
jgi:heavy metal sensor kinase